MSMFVIAAIALFSLLLAFVLVYWFVIAPKFIGRSGSEGSDLKKYIPSKKLQELVDSPEEDILIIDTRPESAYRKGHIPGALSFSSDSIASRLDELPKDKKLIVHCETGGRAQKVIEDVLKPNGYTQFMNWGGISRWEGEKEEG